MSIIRALIISGLLGLVSGAQAFLVRDVMRSVGAANFNILDNMVVDSGGNVYLGGMVVPAPNAPHQIKIVKLDSNGNLLATFQTSVATGVSCYQMVGDGAGNLYAIGAVEGGPTAWYIVKVSTFNLTPSTSWADTGSGVGVRTFPLYVPRAALYNPASGNLIVTGWDSPANQNGITIQLTRTGALSSVWPAAGGSPIGIRTTTFCRGERLALDSSGNVYVGGSHADGASFYDAVLKYTSAGALSSTWPDIGLGVGIRSIAGGIPTSLYVDSSGDAYQCGYGGTGPDLKGYAVRYDPNGSMHWIHLFPQTVLRGLSPDGGDLLLSGNIVRPDGSTAASIVRVGSSTGAFSSTWPDRGDGAGVRTFQRGAENAGFSMATGQLSNIYAVGFHYVGGVAKGLVVGFTDGGDRILADATGTNPPDDIGSFLSGVAIDSSGRPIVAGQDNGSAGGTFSWARYRGPLHSGRVTLLDYVDFRQVHPRIQIRTPGTQTVLEEYQVDLTFGGEFELPTSRVGLVDLSCKPSHWLRDTFTNYTLNSGGDGLTPIAFTVINSDVDGDNEVSIGDFSQLSAAFNSFMGDPRYNFDADLDGDFSVDIGDYSILSSNFGLFGED